MSDDTMKMYRYKNGQMFSADVMIGSVCLEVGSTVVASPDDGKHLKLKPIAYIDFSNRIYRRMGSDPIPFPEKYFRNSEPTVWIPVDDPRE